MKEHNWETPLIQATEKVLEFSVTFCRNKGDSRISQYYHQLSANLLYIIN